MGWFDEQIKQRKKLDDEVFSDSFVNMAGAILGSRVYTMLNDNRVQVKDSLDEILKFYRVKTRELPDNITDVNEQLEFLLRPYGIMRRTVELEKGWYKDAIGAMLTVRKADGAVIALIPRGLSGYSFYNPDTGRRELVTRFNESDFETEAVAFYKPLPMRKIGLKDLIAYMFGVISTGDVVLFGVTAFAASFVGLLTTKLTNVLYSNVVETKSISLLLVTALFMICVLLSSLLFNSIKTLFQARINTKLNISVESAVMMRVLSLQPSFFKKYSSGELSSRVGNVSVLCEMLVSSILSTGLVSIFSLVNITMIAKYARGLVGPALLIILVTTVFSLVSTLVRMKTTRKLMNLGAQESGLSYALITGVQKIKLSGAEKRAFAKWGNLFAKHSQLTYNPNIFLKVNGAISTAISLCGTIILYGAAVKDGLTVADYAAFISAFGVISGAFSGLTSIVQSAASLKPILEMCQPLLDAEPEVSEGKAVITRLSGSIEINNISFRYNDSMPNVIDDLSLKIRPGQYLAIVGTTGCGKSTLLRCLLGFEKPQSGAIYFDGKDINTIDLKSLRRKIGVVMQDGRLFSGDIFSNITISAPWLTLDDAWEAAEMAGIAEDIRRMPMGMHTLVSEGAGGISGGQRQRLMIARAIAPKPRILMFDEATSALDNITQKKVSDSLDSLKCTRIVIAHRLSTIKHCDRIICLDKGKIIEDGTYDELIAKGGFFAELVERQRINPNE